MHNSRAVKYCCYILICWTIVHLTLTSCHTQSSPPKEVVTYCAGCHLLPDPKSLTKEMWTTSILPKMSMYFIWNGASTFDYANKRGFSDRALYLMTDAEWQVINDYFGEHGLDDYVLREPYHLPVQDFFEEDLIWEDSTTALITAIAPKEGGGIYIAQENKLFTVDQELSIVPLVETTGDILDIFEKEGSLHWVNSGTIHPHEGAFGRLESLRGDSIDILIDDLRRPVQAVWDGSGYWIAEFGYYSGGLSKWYSGSRSKKVHKLPGTYRILPMHLYSTDQQDWVISVAQAAEGIYAIVDSLGEMNIRPILRFGPEYGLSDIDIVDIDGDGLDDLSIANGDNADYSIMPKSYHGIRVYLNLGSGRFEQKYYLPAYGATQIKWIDINGDGQQDLVASCYFAERAAEGLLICIAEGDFKYKVYGVEASTAGAWMTLSTVDIDLDGDQDIVAGSYAAGPKANILDQSEPSLLVLKNKKYRVE